MYFFYTYIYSIYIYLLGNHTFPIPGVSPLGEVVDCGKFDEGREDEGIADGDEPVHSCGIGHFRKWVPGADTEGGHGQDGGHTCGEIHRTAVRNQTQSFTFMLAADANVCVYFQRVNPMLLTTLRNISFEYICFVFQMEAVPSQPATWEDAWERNWVRAYRMMQRVREYATAEVSTPHHISLNSKWCTNAAWAEAEGVNVRTLTFRSTHLCLHVQQEAQAHTRLQTVSLQTQLHVFPSAVAAFAFPAAIWSTFNHWTISLA